MHRLSIFDQPAPAPLAPLPTVVCDGLAGLGWQYERTEGELLVFSAPGERARWYEGGRERLTPAAWQVRYRALAGLCWQCGGELVAGVEVDQECCTACAATGEAL